MILAFFGPPGSGKGTQAKMLAEKLKIPHISLGDLLRAEIRQETEIGKRIKQVMTTGLLVPDEITNELTRQRTTKPDCSDGFILDGYPRSEIQAEAMEAMPFSVDKVLYFKINEDEVVKRLSGRRSCKACGAVYHVKFKQPKVEGQCDLDQGELYQRPDDEEKAIRVRFDVYAKQTEPLLKRYEAAGKLETIDVSGSIEEVFAKLLKTVSNGGN
ncbi:MAG: adenylate kinase [bacterium]